MDTPAITSPPLGVTLGFFRHLIDLCGGRTKLQGRTTAQVCFDYIVPLTASTQLSLVEHIAADPATAHFVRPANWYISHAWSYLFLETVDSLDVFFAQQQLSDEAVVWFCVFNNNQHRAAGFPFEYWSSTFKSQLSVIGNVVMVMHPWNDPVVLRRSWCVFEVYVAVTTGARFEMAMAPAQFALLVKDMSNVFALFTMLGTIKSEQSETTIPSDRDGIFALIKAETLFIEVDRLVFSTIRDWMGRSLSAYAQSLDDRLEEATVWRYLLRIYDHDRKWADSEPVIQRVIACYTEALGDDHEDTLAAKTWPYFLQASSGLPHATWGPPLHLALLNMERRLGSANRQVCIVRCSYTTKLVEAKVEYNRAAELLHTNYEILLSTVGPLHAAALATATDLGRVYTYKHQLPEAERWLNVALASAREAFDDTHPIPSFGQLMLAMVYVADGRLRQALTIAEQQLAVKLRLFGAGHAETVEVQHFAGLVLHRLGAFDQAKLLLNAGMDSVPAPDDESVADREARIITQTVLALVYWAERDYAAAARGLSQTALACRHSSIRHARKAAAWLYCLLMDPASTVGDDTAAWSAVSAMYGRHTDTSEAWDDEHCTGCHRDLVGTMRCCNECPRGSYLYCRSCTTLGRVLCSHDTATFLAFKPPHRHLLEEDLKTFDGPLDDFEEAIANYAVYCREHGVSDVEKVPRAAFGYEVDSRVWHPML
ncbi:hypothetical protein ACHHYP_12051 [Achlya hypogyna]|uniref:Mbre TPR repeat protein n=1 Tax=Achlya hypogyna TaxID=1202772 RepID=A0A1V9YHR2_ACHHY|nr:hypothetical protein ACHHYP_12051 [Achlya hypogyna]